MADWAWVMVSLVIAVGVFLVWSERDGRIRMTLKALRNPPPLSRSQYYRLVLGGSVIFSENDASSVETLCTKRRIFVGALLLPEIANVIEQFLVAAKIDLKERPFVSPDMQLEPMRLTLRSATFALRSCHQPLLFYPYEYKLGNPYSALFVDPQASEALNFVLRVAAERASYPSVVRDYTYRIASREHTYSDDDPSPYAMPGNVVGLEAHALQITVWREAEVDVTLMLELK